MDVAVAEFIWGLVAGYFAIGVLVALVLTLGAVRRFDPLAAEASWPVKLLLVPGMAALWPFLITKAIMGRAR